MVRVREVGRNGTSENIELTSSEVESIGSKIETLNRERNALVENIATNEEILLNSRGLLSQRQQEAEATAAKIAIDEQENKTLTCHSFLFDTHILTTKI